MKKGTNGITLLALVVTIIILLILTSITISALTESSIFEKAILSRVYTRKSQAQEYLELEIEAIGIEKKGEISLLDILDDFKQKERTDIIVTEIVSKNRNNKYFNRTDTRRGFSRDNSYCRKI